ncbi:hypothetical protein GpartN1_g7638.t1 [Galdieria partita]|uniref:Acyl carrier protein n=1 Tax=Galdieria partita TaxID=83374 RepID=A0A9C7Q4X7_9RHOD|nr:hypothetical protein GpartN1_g7333.t1 [Galdieria partita]GJQ15847.1 hypothetical protein GpartN1_g7638.t1 [Galdieria partita]
MSWRCFVGGFFRPASWRAIVYKDIRKPNNLKGQIPLRSCSTSHSWEPKPLESVPLGSGIAFSKNVYMDPEEVTERVLEVVKLFEKVDPIKVHREADFEKDLGLDSLDTVELLIALEDEFEVEIPDEHAEKMSNCLDVIRYFSTHLYAT